MGHHSSAFLEIIGKCASILPGLVGSLLLANVVWLGRQAKLPRRQQFDHLWPVLIIWLVTMGQSVLQFMPHPSRWMQITLLCIEAAVGVVIWRKTWQTIRQAPPEHREAFRQLVPLSRVKPVWLVVAVGLVIIISGAIGYVMGG